MVAVLAHLLLVLAVGLGEGGWPLPAPVEVANGFDPPESRWEPGHRGMDLVGRPGQLVRAAASGTVTYAGRLVDRGVVVVRHGEHRTTYEPVTANVEVGERVLRGQPLGELRAAQSHCWPRTCLHWGLVRGERYLDPRVLVGGAPVRLLPLVGDPDSLSDPTPSSLSRAQSSSGPPAPGRAVMPFAHRFLPPRRQATDALALPSPAAPGFVRLARHRAGLG